MRLQSGIKYALYVLLLLLVFTFQSTFGRILYLFNVRPDFIPALVACIAVWEPILPAALLGLWAGLLSDTLSISGIYFSVFYYFSAAGIAYLCRRRFYPHPIIALFALLLLILLSQGLRYLFYYLPFFHASIFHLLWVLPTEIGFNLLVFYPFFALCRKLHTRFPSRSVPKAAAPKQTAFVCRITRFALSANAAQRRMTHGKEK